VREMLGIRERVREEGTSPEEGVLGILGRVGCRKV